MFGCLYFITAEQPKEILVIRPALPFGVSLLILASGGVTLHAQQVRIASDETAVRLDPDASSPVITNLAAGTLVDWIGESGPFYTISLPGETGQDNLVGYVLASEVEVVGTRVPQGGAPSTGATAAAEMSIPDLERQYEREMERRGSGKKKIIWGVVLAAASYAALEYIPPLGVPDRADYDSEEDFQSARDRRNAAETGRSVVTGLSAALGTWGAIQWGYGYRNTRNLGLNLRRSSAPSIDERYAQAQERRSSGRSKVWWGLFLIGASYAAVEWIPYFGEPAVEDFETPEDYQDALDRNESAEKTRTWIMRAGGALGAWGGTQWVLAARDLSEIEAAVRATSTALAVPVGLSGDSPDRAVATELFMGREGPRTVAGLRWTW